MATPRRAAPAKNPLPAAKVVFAEPDGTDPMAAARPILDALVVGWLRANDAAESEQPAEHETEMLWST